MSCTATNAQLKPTISRTGSQAENYEASFRAERCRRVPELLAPAGDWECAKAAVENGADAIYFGLEKFNARMRAQNFTESDLPALMDFLHRRGVKGYVTFNTLVFQNEMREAELFARAIICAGVDAAIVQDVGICRLLRELSPDFPLHVSTQMTVTSAAGIEFTRNLGCNLVVLARECSLGEIEKIQTAQQRSQVGESAPVIPLEVFVHGALCVAYSGQCLTSEALGGRSANRGECAQACRMPYELISDGSLVALGDRKYLLSPQDLAGLEVLPELTRLGVASLKIEGRLKSPEYVANITRIYRQALDALDVTGKALQENEEETRSIETAGSENPKSVSQNFRYEMEMAFSRGLHTGWLGGINNQELVHARFGKKRGVYLGQIIEVRRDGVIAQLEGPLKPGDGIVFDAGQPEEKEEGGRIYEISAHKPKGSSTGTFLLRFGKGDIDFERVHAGDRLWKTSDPELERRLRRSFEGEAPRFQRPIYVELHGLVGKPLSLLVRDELGHVVRLDSTMPLVPAEKQPLTSARLREQLGRLGGTPFRLGELKNCIEGQVLVPLSELNRLRRDMVAEMLKARTAVPRWTIQEPCADGPVEAPHGQNRATSDSIAVTPQIVVLVRNLAQLEAAVQCGIQTVYCDFEDPKKYREAVVRFRNMTSKSPSCAIFVAPPRIFKMGEDWILKQVRSCEADGYLVRNYDHLAYFKNDRCVGDYSLNIANSLAARYFKENFSLERVTTSYDLNFSQLESLLQTAPPQWFEVTIHQHMPMFHMEHCVFCAFLSKGTDYTNCGRPCDKHDVKLKDRVGAGHPIKADIGCRNTVFNALAQTGAEYVTRMLQLGVRHLRLEFLNETASQLSITVEKYRALLRSEISGAELWRELKLFNQLGVTRGQIAGSAIRS
jgi:putative protease